MTGYPTLMTSAAGFLFLLAVSGLTLTPVGAQENAGEPIPYSDYGADTCLACHDEDSEFPVVAIFKTKHAIAADERTPFAQYQCESCHGPGGAHTGRVRRGQERPRPINFGRDAHTPVDEQNAICAGCHQQQLATGWHGGTHEMEGLACADCHTLHAARDPVVDVKTQPEVCFGCHRKQKSQSFKFSTHPIRYGKMACTSCHNPHGSVAEFQLVRNNLNETCYSCHTEKRGPFLWEHAPVAEDCSLCHNAHGSNHPALLKRRMPLLCQQCHSQAGHPSLSHTTAGVPPNGASGFLLAGSCTNCHAKVHGSNHPSGPSLTR